MDRYEILEKAGSGHFSEVFRARDKNTGEIVAVKDLNYSEEVQKLLMKYLQILSGLDHPNIIRMIEVRKSPNQIRVIFEYMEENLLELYTTSKKGINENQLRCILFQSALGLYYLHKKKIIHRDIKPENIMINRSTAFVKLIDFGLAKEEGEAKTDYVATRWYRSPENLVGLKRSTVKIDIFALGCVAIELYNSDPLFPGTDTVDQLSKIFSLLGTPSETSWPEGLHELQRKNVTFTPQPRIGVSCMIPEASAEFKDLMENMLQLDPVKRISARKMLTHPFFSQMHKTIPPSIYKFAQELLSSDNPPPKPATSAVPTSIKQVLPNNLSPTSVNRPAIVLPNMNSPSFLKYGPRIIQQGPVIQQITQQRQPMNNISFVVPNAKTGRGQSLPTYLPTNLVAPNVNPISRKIYISPYRSIVENARSQPVFKPNTRQNAIPLVRFTYQDPPRQPSFSVNMAQPRYTLR